MIYMALIRGEERNRKGNWKAQWPFDFLFVLRDKHYPISVLFSTLRENEPGGMKFDCE